jgi:CRISPR-associated endonuclease Csn1
MDYVLGLDVGTNSVGWAALRLQDRRPVELIRTGVRVFPAGKEGDVEHGRGTPRSVQRRQARQLRRQIERTARRKRKLLHILQRNGLLPQGGGEAVFEQVGENLRAKWHGHPDAPPAIAHVLPYFLRARALDHPLEPHELGVALYHLAQRRGFASNRRTATDAEDEEEQGKVKEAIAGLAADIEGAGARTLGEFLCSLDPEQQRIRNRYLGREMVQTEFEAIWAAQAPHHPDVLTDVLHREVREAIFYQRPLKSQSHLIGGCSLEPGRRRAPWCRLLAQRFRLLQKLNDLEVIESDGQERGLTGAERRTLYDALDAPSKKMLTKGGKFTLARARRLLGLPRGARFNLEEGGEKNMPYNTTAARLVPVFGERWHDLNPEEQDQVVEDLYSFEKKDALARRGRKQWGLGEKEGKRFGNLELERDYCSHSMKALSKLVPLMQGGLKYYDALEEAYPDRHEVDRALDELPPVLDVLGDLRNPVVMRSLTEVRKVVNAVVRNFGKPAHVRIELARELKQSRRRREDAWRRNREIEGQRQGAARRLAGEMGITEPCFADVQKVGLADECDWTCPYTGQSFGWNDLFGANPAFDVEHIIPYSRSLDNSFANKTICQVRENRQVKRNQTPHEAYHGTDAWPGIIERVRKFRSRMARAKLARFQMEEVPAVGEGQLAERELNDTRYISRKATQYLSVLYGGDVVDGTRRVHSTQGRVTGLLRAAWGLNDVLGEGAATKERGDHRHHAVDAAVVAATDAGMIQSISAAHARLGWCDGDWFPLIEVPWDGFREDIEESVKAVNVSHRVDRSVNAQLHDETIYSPPRDADGRPDAEGEYVHYRKRLAEVSPDKVDRIVDPAVRRAVQEKLAELGIGEPKRAFKDEANHPHLTARDGRQIPIHSARIRVREPSVVDVGGPAPRYVKPNSNHHVEFFEVPDGPWEARLVTTLEAARRLREGEPVVNREHDGQGTFLFSLASTDSVMMDNERERGLYVVSVISQTAAGRLTLEFREHADARPETVRRKTKGARLRRTLGSFCRSRPQKVTVNPFGLVRDAND